MFQSFDSTSDPSTGPERLARLRAEMAAGGIDAFLVPRADAHQGEYVAERDARLQWLTGFTGSAGIAAVTAEAAAIFVDGRYKVQVKSQVAPDFVPVDYPATRPGTWLGAHLPEGATIGFDRWLHSRAEIDALRVAVGVRRVAPVDNPVDAIWTDQPAPPRGAVRAFPEEIAGRSRAEKCADIAGELTAQGQAWAVLTLPDSIAWLLNIRGDDIPRIPVAQGFALIEAGTGRVRLFMDEAKLADVALEGVSVLPPESILQALSNLSGPVRLDGDTAPYAMAEALEEAGVEIAYAPDPCLIPKARKTEAEIAATREAHLRDGAAVCAFLHWLEGRLDAVVREDARLTEIDVVTALEGFRAETGALTDISFETIAGSGPHGAINHYRVTHESDRAVRPGELLLVDSGGQYLDGTTDITRTMPVGAPDTEQIAASTRVLQGMIALSRARWPKGLAGRDLDALARAPLWMAGQDYDHGTGHGVGVHLSVHEGPQRISRRSEVPLESGMILSNEPGYYREGAWGIRIENLIVVQEPAAPVGADAEREMFAFETLTWVPIDRRLIDVAALSPDERAWIDAYHAEVADRIGGRVAPEVAEWLSRATAPL